MAQILQPYKVPVVFNDLAPEEAMTDAFYALEALSATIDDIFGRIEKRISDERRRVDHIRSRVANCQNKVHQVRGSKKATTVFSTAKFPAPKTLPSYPTLFSQIHELRSPFREADEEVQYLPPHPAHSVVGNKELYGELQDIVVRLNTYGTDLERVEFTMEDDGLGKLPHDVPSVGSLLLFNSNINPYKEYQTLDNLVSAGREKQAGDDDAGKQLANAPSTILSGDALPDIAGLDLTFKPSMGEMSQLALPENLPLDFIANINFTAGVDLPSIAPSAHMANRANYNLPQLTDGRTASTASASAYAPPPSAKASTAPPPPPPPPARTTAPPPPPPPAPAQSAAGTPAASSTGPPPPPAPAVAASAPAVAVQDAEDMEPAAASAAAAGGRQGLSFLDAIKGMSVSKLRNKEESAMAAAKVQKKVEQTKPLSMAEALKERLARRNEALSGKNDKEEKRRDSLIVQAARTQQEQQRQAPPAAATAPKKPSPLLSLGFAAVADKGNDSDDDGFNYAKPGFAPKRGGDSDDTESDTVSEFSEDSRAYSVQGSGGARPFASSPMNSAKPAPIPAPVSNARVPVAAAAPPPPSRRGTGLLGSAQVDSMLSQTQALRKKPAHDGSDEDDDWD